MNTSLRDLSSSPPCGHHDPRADLRCPSRLCAVFGGIAVLIVSALLTSGCAPVITGVAPATAKPGDVVVIHGKRLGEEVRFAGRPASEVVIHGDTSVSAKVPEGVSSGPITVANGWGVAVSPVELCALLCWFGLETDTVNLLPGGAEQTLDVWVPPSCHWFGQPGEPWIEVSSPYVGRVPRGWSIGAMGPEELRFTVAPNCSDHGGYAGSDYYTGCRPPRSGTITLEQTLYAPTLCPARATVSVRQQGVASAPPRITLKKCVPAGHYGSRIKVTLGLQPGSHAEGESLCLWARSDPDDDWLPGAGPFAESEREIDYTTGTIDSGVVWIHLTVCTGSARYHSPPSNVVRCHPGTP